MLKKRMLIVALGTVGLVGLAGTARANDRDMLATTVPATACEPLNSSHANEVQLSNAAWVFRGSHTGTITFYCPVPRNAWTLSDNTNDNDISAYRIYYRDSDGTGTTAQVTARLVYRGASGLFSAGSTWNSNNHAATGNTTAFKENVHDVRFDALYSFLVTLRRTNTQQAPAFSGIDFATIPVP